MTPRRLDSETGSVTMFQGMRREYIKWHSPSLQREMELLAYGERGFPIVVFPTSGGRFFEYEDRGMIGALASKIDRGELQVFCPDGVDTESWYNKGVHPRVRVMRHLQYERYILHEFLPFIRWKNQAWQLAVTHIKNPELVLERVNQIMKTELDQEHIDRLNEQLLDVTQRLKKLMQFAMDTTDDDVIAMAKEKRQMHSHRRHRQRGRDDHFGQTKAAFNFR